MRYQLLPAVSSVHYTIEVDFPAATRPIRPGLGSSLGLGLSETEVLVRRPRFKPGTFAWNTRDGIHLMIRLYL